MKKVSLYFLASVFWIWPVAGSFGTQSKRAILSKVPTLSSQQPVKGGNADLSAVLGKLRTTFQQSFSKRLIVSKRNLLTGERKIFLESDMSYDPKASQPLVFSHPGLDATPYAYLFRILKSFRLSEGAFKSFAKSYRLPYVPQKHAKEFPGTVKKILFVPQVELGKVRRVFGYFDAGDNLKYLEIVDGYHGRLVCEFNDIQSRKSALPSAAL